MKGQRKDLLKVAAQPEYKIPPKKQTMMPINQAATDNNSSTDANVNQNGSWNKPIYIEKMVLRSSELCPPMSMKDDDDLPAVFQSIDKIMEVVWRRALAEIAKSNTGRLFSTAFGEILSVMVTNPHHSIPLYLNFRASAIWNFFEQGPYLYHGTAGDADDLLVPVCF